MSLAKSSDLEKANASQVDFIEIRSDLYPEADFQILLDRAEKPVIFTVKSKHPELLFFAGNAQVKFVDLDYQMVDEIETFKNSEASAGLIVSYHDYEKTPLLPEALSLLSELEGKKADKIKMAFQINEFSDLAVIAKLQKKLGEKGIVIGMGSLGQISRIYNQAWLTFAALSEEGVVAPGQIPIDKMSTKKIFGLLGKGIDYSLSPKIYNEAFEHHQLPHEYLLFDVEDFETFEKVFRFFKLPACSVTQPYKKKALALADIKDHDAKKIGAANLLVQNSNGEIVAYNSDWEGVLSCLGGYLEGARVLILGRGGAALACEYACQKGSAASVELLGREDLPTSRSDYDILINATPVVDELLVDCKDAINRVLTFKNKVVMDCNYKAKSLLLSVAEEMGAKRCVDGMGMLLGQARKHYEMFVGRELPMEVVRELIVKTQNLASLRGLKMEVRNNEQNNKQINQ